MLFAKDNMNYVHYRWEMDEQPAAALFMGEPSRRVFDRFNGHQVLFLINCCARAYGKFSLTDAQMLESKIAYQLPLELKSERSVYNWIIDSVKKFG